MIVTKTSSADLTLLDQQSLAHGLELLARGHSFEAHECFEHVFRIREGRARTLFRALSQLVDSLSVEFQQRVEDLFSAAGAGDGCERLIDPRLISGLTEWPVPDTLRQAP
jgi:predicted metal-dependent hydrolase